MDIPETGPMRVLYDEHAAALWRYALRLTGDQVRARHVMHEALLLAQRNPEVFDNAELSARAWLFTQARNMVGGDRHHARLTSSNGSGALQPAGRSEGDLVLKRMLVGDAIAQLSDEHRAVLGRSYHQRWTTARIAADIGIDEDTVKLRLHHALRMLRQSLLDMGVTQ
jgi:RNA polymerase sigma-70 factor (ECF subfamily)